MAITRRDFLNGVAITVAAGMTPLQILQASPRQAQKTLYYPPSLTGLRGNHPGSFENAHRLGRDNVAFDFASQPVTEAYDLVVVGAGISGLAAACFWQQLHGKQQRILLIDNHDDFGGHAKRNELNGDGGTLLGYGGSESFQSPRSNFSPVVMDLIHTLGISLDGMEQGFDKTFYPDLGLSRGVYFDRKNFGVDKVVSGDPGRVVADDIPRDRLNGRSWQAFINDFPLPESDREALIALHTVPKDYLPGLSQQEKVAWLDKHSYSTFLREKVGLSEQAIRYFQQSTNDFQAVGIDATACSDARICDLPGLDGMGLPPLDAESQADLDDPYVFHFPDGNATLARLMVRKLIPGVTSAGQNMNDIVQATFDYSQLDRPDSPVRLRLNSTGMQVVNVDNHAEVSYITGDTLTRVRAGRVIMAGYNMMIPYLVPQMSPAQQEALKQNVKAPLVYSKVKIANWQPFMQLGIHEFYAPGAPYSRVKLDYPVSLGGYHHPHDPQQPIGLHMVYVPTLPGSGLSPREQSRKGRAMLLGTPFEVHEQMIREQLQAMLGPAGFDHQRDIQAITVNRWSHGYSYALSGMFDDEEEAQRTIERARAPVGHIFIANADADWSPYAHSAIDQAWRAVNEPAGGTSAPGEAS
ncbi:spermidine dehydrogenase [Erwinia persicina]|uniref:NAD(P)-binding protein n=1 Tax=Erwinia persicina TaxID=55211 RepID=UPI000E472CAD|nr:FAD/NAD(P)-binding protein [Erwinia persicina]AXU94003.1 spermidine dehydrogenase [Erwinia persicina]MBC3946019.1 NAD(P)-binding protein [Erwinia persicina]MBD8168600.1 NAD(P)-binding protein [Erwinia persicina]